MYGNICLWSSLITSESIEYQLNMKILKLHHSDIVWNYSCCTYRFLAVEIGIRKKVTAKVNLTFLYFTRMRTMKKG